MAVSANTAEIEIWKPVLSIGDGTEASNLGRVRIPARKRNAGRGKVATVKERVTLGYLERGYRMIGLATGRKLYAHRLVCEAFHGPSPEGKQHVAHYDGDKSNNRPENLRWASDAENKQDGIRLGEILTGERHPAAKLSVQDVCEIRTLHSAIGGRRGAISEIARLFGITPAHARDIITRRIWKECPA